MKLAMDDRFKHRIVGLAVVVSVAAMILPAVVKKSNQSINAMSRVALRLPERPHIPKVVVADEAHLFKKMQITEVNIPVMPATTKQQTSEIQANSLQSNVVVRERLAAATPKIEPRVQPVERSILPAAPKVSELLAPSHPSAEIRSAKSVQPRASVRTVASSNAAYSVQVASFSSHQNAKQLFNKLQTQGYHAKVTPVKIANGSVNYKVLVGRGIKRQEMVQLQRQLYSKMQLRGFVVPTNVG